MTHWLYIIVLWADFSQPRPVPFPTLQACEQAKRAVLNDDSRHPAFRKSLIITCSPVKP
jgi:hypothetical protein